MTERKLIVFLINSSFGISAVRNQGQGMIQPIRDMLIEHFDPSEFFRKLNSSSITVFRDYLNALTNKLYLKKGYTYLGSKENKHKVYTKNKIKWGTARKCINLFLRNLVYNGFIWKSYNLSKEDFNSRGIFRKLELPLDSYSIAGLKKYCLSRGWNKYNTILKNFTITKLKLTRSFELQKLATRVAREKETCRVNLDVEFWRAEQSEQNQ